jgi:ssDNA-binding Zn-finger/Zn-ribbon topoisomerase 1
MTNCTRFPTWRKCGIVIKLNDNNFSWCENTPANRKYLKTSEYCSKAIEFYVWENDTYYYSKIELDKYFEDRELNPQKYMTCLLCGNSLVIRRNRQNREVFLGCSEYPDCKFTKKA